MLVRKALCLFALSCISLPASAQSGAPTAAEMTIAAQLKCEDFHKNPDGSWTSGPNAKIGDNVVSNSTFSERALSFNGVDPAVVLNRKCTNR
jgi:hypothetical protein